MNHANSPATPSTRRSIVSNFLYLALGQALYKITALVGLSLLARYLGSDEFGRFTVALAAVQLFELLTDAGIGQSLVRNGTGRPDRLAKDLAAALPLRVALAGVNVVLAVLLVTATNAEPQVRELTLWLGIAHGVSALTVLLRVVFQTFERMEYVSLSVTMEGVLRLAAIIGGLAGVMGLVGIAKALVVAEVVVFASTALVVGHRFLLPRFAPLPWRRTIEVLSLGAPFAAAWLLLGVDQRINILLLGRFAGEAQVAAFGAAGRLLEMTLIVPTVLATALFPAAVRHEREGLPALAALLTASLKVIIAVAIPVALALEIFAAPIVLTVFGTEFADAIVTLMIMAPATVLLYARIGLVQTALALGRLRIALVAQVAALAVDLVLAIALIPSLGQVGAAVALVGAELFAVAWMVWLLRASFGESGVLNVSRPLLAGAAAAAASIALSGGPLLIEAIGVGSAYLLVFRLNPVFTRQEYLYVRAAVPALGVLMSFAVKADA